MEQKCNIPFEVICCDDGSKDRTPDMVVSFPAVKQVPRPDARYLMRKDKLRAFNNGREAARWSSFFSLAARRDPVEHPFDENISCSKDVEWSYRRPVQTGAAVRHFPEPFQKLINQVRS